MNPVYFFEEPRPLTIGELCEALADGTVQAQSGDGYYVIHQRDLAHLAEAQTRKVINLDMAAIQQLVAVS